MAPALAAHDDFAELAVRSVQGESELRLAVARALAPAQPQAALQALAGFSGYREWSAGSKLWRGGSFAKVEVARAMTSVDAALDVLAAERDHGDGQAALVAMGMLLTGDDRGVEFAESLGNSIRPAAMLARFALGVEAPLITDQAITAGREWQRGDLDLLQRFNPVLATSPAVIRADYARLLRSIRFEDAETPRDAALSALVQLLVIDDLRDGDAELLAQHFKAARWPTTCTRPRLTSDRVGQPRRAAALALDSGPTSTWTLRDVLRDVAARDLGLAIELTDTVDPGFSGTRSVILGAVGALVDPQNTRVIAELNRRIAPPESSGLVTAVLDDVSLRVAALLPDGDVRARRLLERSTSGADYPVAKNFSHRAGDQPGYRGRHRRRHAVDGGGDGEPSANGRTRAGGLCSSSTCPRRSGAMSFNTKALPRAKGRERHWRMCTLASLNPWAVIGQMLDNLLDPHTFATVLQLVNETLTDSALRDHIKIVVEHRVAAAPANQALLLWWAASRTSLGTSSEARPLRPEYELLWSRLAGDDPNPILEACDTIDVEPAVFLAVWVYDQPTRLPRAVRAIIGRFRDGDVGALPTEWPARGRGCSCRTL